MPSQETTTTDISLIMVLNQHVFITDTNLYPSLVIEKATISKLVVYISLRFFKCKAIYYNGQITRWKRKQQKNLTFHNQKNCHKP